MNNSIYISVLGLSLSVINDLKRIITEQILSQYKINWTNIADKNLQILLISDDLIELTDIKRVNKAHLHILKLSKNENLAGKVRNNTLYLPLHSAGELSEWLKQAITIPQSCRDKTAISGPECKEQPKKPKLSCQAVYSAFDKVYSEYSNINNFMIKSGLNIIAFFDVKKKEFYLNTDLNKFNLSAIEVVPADINNIVNFKSKYKSSDLSHGIWQFVWGCLAYELPEYSKAYQLLSWPQPALKQERNEVLKISAYFSRGCTGQYVQEKMGVSADTVNRYLFACDIARMIGEIPEQEALYIQPAAAGKAPDHTGRVRGFFSKLRKKLGL